MTVLDSRRSGEPGVVAGRKRPGPDVVSFVVMIALISVGVLMIYASTREQLELLNLDPGRLMQRQIMFGVVAVAVYVVGSLIDYREYRNWAGWIYISTLAALILLISPLIPAHENVKRWIDLGIFQVQPSEFAKITMIIVTATVLAPARKEGMHWKRIVQALFLVAIPSLLIFLQPDLGTMLVFTFMTFAVLFAGGATWRQLVALFGGAAAAVAVVFGRGLLKDYQLERLTAFYDPNADPLGIAYQQSQSVTAIGSGQITGKGLFDGALTNLRFVPEQETDFIFTAVGEQLGFIGSAVVIAGFVILIWRAFVVAAT
ncbi:MAG: FtsW/RodA/SpoVE family cell cycle protein, partial [Acidimicrobiia bacterium]|nr:FtsW/RodA/SpoVE family cell cycle protein [Acidimicrobiia bacterium]